MIMVDENGETISCDLLTALLVPYFLEKKPKSAIVYDLRSSRVVMEEIIKYGGTPRRERVGHSFMKKAMRDTHAVFGGELSGPFLLRAELLRRFGHDHADAHAQRDRREGQVHERADPAAATL